MRTNPKIKRMNLSEEQRIHQERSSALVAELLEKYAPILEARKNGQKV